MSENNKKEMPLNIPWQKNGAGGKGKSRSDSGDSAGGELTVYAGETQFTPDSAQELVMNRIKAAAALMFGENGGELSALADELERMAQYGARPSADAYGNGGYSQEQAFAQQIPRMGGFGYTPPSAGYGQRVPMYQQPGSGIPWQTQMGAYGAPVYQQPAYPQGYNQQWQFMGGAAYPAMNAGAQRIGNSSGYAQGGGGALAEKWREEARQLKSVVPEFDLKKALSDKNFTDALASGMSVAEAYAESSRLPKNPQRGALYQNGQSARRGTGEASRNPADLSPEDFKKYIEKLKEQ